MSIRKMEKDDISKVSFCLEHNFCYVFTLTTKFFLNISHSILISQLFEGFAENLQIFHHVQTFMTENNFYFCWFAMNTLYVVFSELNSTEFVENYF